MAQSFCPSGLQAVRSLTAASWSGQTQTFMTGCMNGATYVPFSDNIFSGDPVVLSSGGLSSPSWLNVANAPAGIAAAEAQYPVGVFVGCSFESAPNTNTGFNTTSSGSPMYLAGTSSYTGMPVKAQVISDPNVIFTILMTGTAAAAGANPAASTAPLTAAQKTALANGAGGYGMVNFQWSDGSVGISAGAAVLAQGNTTTGQSSAFLSMGNTWLPGTTNVNPAAMAAAGMVGACLVEILGISENPSLNPSFADPYLFVECRIANHFYLTPVTARAPQMEAPASGAETPGVAPVENKTVSSKK